MWFLEETPRLLDPLKQHPQPCGHGFAASLGKTRAILRKLEKKAAIGDAN